MKWRTGMWLSFLPIPVLLGLVLVLQHVVPPSLFYDPPWLLPITNTLFVTVVDLLVAFLALRTYRATGQPHALLLGCGVLTFGVGGVIAGFARAVPEAGANLNVTIYNTGALGGAVFHLAAAFLLLSGWAPTSATRRTGRWTVLGAVGPTAFLVGFSLASFHGLVPPFFVQEVGPTMLRQLVLGGAVALFAFAWLVFLGTYIRIRERFLYWYSSALALTAISLLAFFIQRSVGSPVGWVGRGAQYVGGVYFLLAVVMVMKDARTRRTSFGEVLATSFRPAELLAQVARERDRAEMQAREAQRRAEELDAVFEAMNEAVLVYDPTGRPTKANRAAVAAFGFDPAGSERVSRAKAIRLRYPDGHPVPPEELPTRRAERGERFRDERFLITDAQGNDCLIRYSAAPLVLDDRLVGTVSVWQDITAQERAEAARRESAEWLRVTLTSIGDAVLATDATGRITFLNPIAEALTGWKAAEAAGQPVETVFRIINERSRQPAEDLVARVIREGAVVNLANHTALLARDGREVPIEDSAAPIRDRAGQVTGVVVVFHDVTEKRRVEEALQEQARILDLAPVLIRDLASRIVLWNTGAAKLYGYTAAEAVGRISHELFRTVFPVSCDALNTALQTEGTWDGELIHTAKDGRRVVVASHQVLHRSADGTPRAILEVNSDITARKQAEEALRLSERKFAKAFTVNPAGITLTRLADGQILDVNDTWLQTLGFARAEVLGRTTVELQVWPDAAVRERLVEELRQAGTVRGWEGPLRTQGGALIFGFLSAEVLTVGDEPVVLTAFVDISARKQAEEQLRQLNATLEQRVHDRTAELSRAVETLEHQAAQLRSLAGELTLAEQRERRRLATVLHDEHQQLLVAAKLRVTMLGRAADPQVQAGCHEATTLLDEAIEHSRALTRDLSPPILHAGGLVPALTWLVGWMGEKHKLAIEVTADPPVLPASEEVTVLLYQSVRELLFNVVKHAHVAEARLTIASQDDQVRIQVSDAGVGFDPAQLRAEGGTGDGFGLFSIRQRLALLGGGLEIASRPGQGSKFALWAPLQMARPAGPSVPVAETPAPAPQTLPPSGSRKLRILLVDDHVVVRQGFARLLSAESDLEVVGEAADGKEAIDLTCRLLPDVVTMDVNMPVLDGIEATRQVRGLCPAVRVIGLSMFESTEQARAMRDVGAAAYVAKSCPAEELLAAIRGGG